MKRALEAKYGWQVTLISVMKRLTFRKSHPVAIELAFASDNRAIAGSA